MATGEISLHVRFVFCCFQAAGPFKRTLRSYCRGPLKILAENNEYFFTG